MWAAANAPLPPAAAQCATVRATCAPPARQASSSCRCEQGVCGFIQAMVVQPSSTRLLVSLRQALDPCCLPPLLPCPLTASSLLLHSFPSHSSQPFPTPVLFLGTLYVSLHNLHHFLLHGPHAAARHFPVSTTHRAVLLLLLLLQLLRPCCCNTRLRRPACCPCMHGGAPMTAVAQPVRSSEQPRQSAWPLCVILGTLAAAQG